jgi:hypothetical protein
MAVRHRTSPTTHAGMMSSWESSYEIVSLPDVGAHQVWAQVQAGKKLIKSFK